MSGDSRAEMPSSTRSYPAPPRSILFTKMSAGMRSRRSARISTRVCGCTPSTAEMTSTAPSSTPSARSTSAMKSGWPGVSIRLTVTSSAVPPPIVKETTAALMVMPRRRSSSSVSVCVLPSSTLPSSSTTPAACSSRSVRLVLPASTCARIPRLSVLTKSHVLCVGLHPQLGGHERSAHARVSSGRWRCRHRKHGRGGAAVAVQQPCRAVGNGFVRLPLRGRRLPGAMRLTAKQARPHPLSIQDAACPRK
jgi:hypothetical protein